MQILRPYTALPLQLLLHAALQAADCPGILSRRDGITNAMTPV